MQSYQNNRVNSNVNINTNVNNNQRTINTQYNQTQMDPRNQSNSNIIVTQNNTSSNTNITSTPSRCGFNESSVFPVNYMYGQSYVPIQYIDSTFRPEVGLKMGTIFPELVSPYEPGQNMREMQFLASRNINQ